MGGKPRKEPDSSPVLTVVLNRCNVCHSLVVSIRHGDQELGGCGCGFSSMEEVWLNSPGRRAWQRFSREDLRRIGLDVEAVR